MGGWVGGCGTVIKDLMEDGFIPSFCTACYRKVRTWVGGVGGWVGGWMGGCWRRVSSLHFVRLAIAKLVRGWVGWEEKEEWSSLGGGYGFYITHPPTHLPIGTDGRGFHENRQNGEDPRLLPTECLAHAPRIS